MDAGLLPNASARAYWDIKCRAEGCFWHISPIEATYCREHGGKPESEVFTDAEGTTRYRFAQGDVE